MQTLVVFDIGNTTLRNRVEEDCKDAAMIRIQWSVFQGELDPNRRKRLIEVIQRRVQEAEERAEPENKTKKSAIVIHVFSLCAKDMHAARQITRKGIGPAESVIPPDVVIL